MKIGVCYYPEHWPESRWRDDAKHMVSLGIRVVRIGEFAWKQLEPVEGAFDSDWLHRAMDTLHAEGLSVVLGTPTATPPKWLIDKYPSILAIDEHGNPRRFGSRRHYCFSSTVYRRESARIVSRLAKDLGSHPALIAWQTDNEYGCHLSVLSYSDDAASAFQDWCRAHYGDIDRLNHAWGNRFWSMDYNAFREIDPPHQTVTEPNPAHQLAWWRFSSDQVVAFNRLQCDILRRESPGIDILHNYMGNFVEFDHHKVSRDLDIATWDNYPLGFLDRDGAPEADRVRWSRTGHPDSSAFHHDLYRGMCGGRWWVMEQQPGPVNWAPHNPSPLPGMVRLWGLEAFAHGTEVMSYFRWRQLPVAQEQAHTGLCLSNGDEDVAAGEVRQLATDLQRLADAGVPMDAPVARTRAPVALLYSYVGDRAMRLQQPGGSSGLHARMHGPCDPLVWTRAVYGACRRLGLDVDILEPGSALDDYPLVIACTLSLDEQAHVDTLAQYPGTLLLLPRTGSKTTDYAIPDALPPGAFQALLPVRVIRTESIAAFDTPGVDTPDGPMTASAWRERIDSPLAPAGMFDDGWGFHYRAGRRHYLNCWLDDDSLHRFIGARIAECGIERTPCTEGLRLRRRGEWLFAFNYGPGEQLLPVSADACIIGQPRLAVGEVAAWRSPAPR